MTDAEHKALKLIHQILPEDEWNFFTETHRIRLKTKRRIYEIYPDPVARTHVYSHRGRLLSKTCLALVNSAPSYDRMIAEYLIIKNNERLYRKKANIWHYGLPFLSREFSLILLTLIPIFILFLRLMWALRPWAWK